MARELQQVPREIVGAHAQLHAGTEQAAEQLVLPLRSLRPLRLLRLRTVLQLVRPLPLRRLRRRLLLRSVLAGAVCCGCGAWLVCVAVAWLLRGCGVCIVQTVAVLPTAILAGGAPSPS